jgi:hypothetical protein
MENGVFSGQRLFRKGEMKAFPYSGSKILRNLLRRLQKAAENREEGR